MRKQPTLALSGEVVLRSWSGDDVPALMAAKQERDVRRYAASLPNDEGDAERVIARRRGTFPSGQGAAWAIADESGLIGSVGFGVLDEHLRVGSVGYWLIPAARGRGLATAALRLASSVVFEALGWHRIELYHAVENQRSCALALRGGYRFEGIMREAMCYPSDGRWSNEHLHARLESDPEPV